MIDLKFMKPNIVFKQSGIQYRLPMRVKRPEFGSVFIAVTKNAEDTMRYFANGMWNTRYLVNYFHEKLFNFKIFSTIIRYRIQDIELKNLFDNTLSPLNPNLKLIMNKNMLRDRNYIQEVGDFNRDFFEHKDSRPGMVKVNEYFRLFKEFTVGRIAPHHENKVLMIPVDDWIKDPKDITIYNLRRIDNFVSLFFHKLKAEPEYFSENFADWKFFFTLNGQIFLMNPSDFDEDTHKLFRKLISKFRMAKDENPDEDHEIDAIAEAKNKTQLEDKITEQAPIGSLDDETLSNMIDKSADKMGISITDPNAAIHSGTVSKMELDLEKANTELKQVMPKSKLRLAREIKIAQAMKDIKLGDSLTIGDIQARAAANKLEEVNIPIQSINSSLKKMKFPSFDEVYLKNHYMKDMVNMMTGLQYKDRPLYLIDAKVKDISDPLNKLEEYTFTFEDENGKRHNFSIHLPKFINNRFMKLGGNKKLMVNQIIPLPITKTGPDTVQIATNYQKSFMRRFGQNVSPKVIQLYKKLSSLMNRNVKIEVGAAKGNSMFITTIEYDELASRYRKITLPDMTIHFTQMDIRAEMEKMKVKVPDKTDTIIPFAIKGKDIVYFDTNTNKIMGTDKDLLDYIAENISRYDEGFKDVFKGISKGKKYMYSRSLIMAKQVPVILLLAYLEGLLTIMKRANINYRIVSKKDSRNTPQFNKGMEEMIEFEDAWLVYDVYPLRNTLLMNGLVEVPTKMYGIQQFLGKDIYYEIFDTLFGKSNIGYAFENFQALFIDPVTEEILRDFNLPTDFIDVFLYANSLLEDNAYTDDGDMRMHRVRSNEMVYAFMYKVMSKAYERYRLTADKPNPEKFSAKKDAVIIEILTNQVTKDYSDLNPLYTLDLLRSTTFKGPAGMNEDRSFSLSKRSYHPSMVGMLSQASPVSGSIGIVRTLTVDAKISSARGYIDVADTKEDINKLTTSNLVSGAESALPFSVTSDEPERVAMSSAQSRHTLACVGAERNLVYSGFEKVIPHIIGDTFVYKAKKAGTVAKIDTKNQLMVLKYDDGTNDVISLQPEIGKNSGAGFFVSNKLDPLVKEGEKFPADKLVAHNPEFFTTDTWSGDSCFMHGPLTRIAIRYSSRVFEDSTAISKRLSEKLSSHIVRKVDIVLGNNANLTKIVKKGDVVNVNDPILVYDNSFKDDLANKILKTAGSDLDLEAARNIVSSKYNGVVEDIKIYYTTDKENLTESVVDVINYYEKKNKDRLKEISSHVDIKEVDVPSSEVYKIELSEAAKLKGVKMPPDGGVLIEIYIKFKDVFGVGDKLATFIACKAICMDVWDDSQVPYPLNDPNNPLDMYLGAISVGARMTFSLVKTGLSNTVLVGMKDNVSKMVDEIYGKK